MPALFDPPEPPSFEFILDTVYRIDRVGAAAGYDRTQILHDNPTRRAEVNWKGASRATVDYILDFFRRRKGGKVFEYKPPGPTVEQPASEGPELDQVADGSLSSRTYFVKFTWRVVGAGETTPSPASSILVNANNVVTVKVPVFPIGIDAFAVYASETQGAEEFQAEITDTRLWQEPATGLIAGAAPPSVNTAEPTILFTLASSINPRLRTQSVAGGARYRLRLLFDEQFFE